MKLRPLLLLFPLLALCLIGLPLQAQTVVLQQQMGADAFHQAGLDRLSPAELQHLQHWLSAHAVDLANAVPASDANSAAAVAGEKPATGGGFGHKRDDAKKKSRVVTSPVAGSFDGWQPGSVIALQNGQEWRVRDGSLFVPHSLDRPVITVKPGALGGWLMKVDGYNTSARVEPAN